MKRSLRIAVADDERDVRDFFQRALPTMGHEVVVVAQTGRELVEGCRAQAPDIVITDIKMPDMDGLEAAMQIGQERVTPVILVSGFHDDELIARAEADHVMAYLIKPIKPVNIETALVIAIHRFEQFQLLVKEAATLRQALEDRKVIEQAKGILMKKAGLDEAQAFRRLQRMASDRNLRLVNIANMILIAEEAIAPTDPNRAPQA